MNTKKPKQDRLPEMQDAAITELEAAAEEYAEIRDKRQALLGEEVDLKQSLLALMKRYKKEHYEHNGVVVDVVHEDESVKVKIRKPKEESEAA